MFDPLESLSQADLPAVWERLAQIAEAQGELNIRAQFDRDPERISRFTREAVGLKLDFSRHAITPESWTALIDLASTAEVPQAVTQMLSGAAINHTEGRKVLHCALRGGTNKSLEESVLVAEVRERLAALVNSVLRGERTGFSGEAFTDVVNIGIGGSDLGPAMVSEALTPYHQHLKVHFVSNVDPSHMVNTLAQLNPATTLFIIASKTFTTLETLANAKAAQGWLQAAAGSEQSLSDHFVAVSSNVAKAEEFGVDVDSIYPMWDWVGGRYSLWSAIGLPIAIAVGWENFNQLCEGAGAMDEHFASAPLSDNLPVILSLLEIWSVNMLGAQSHAVLPYDQNLCQLPAFLQQLTMESNGKQVDRSGKPLGRASCPVVWGAAGTNGQHSFHQLLHQGTQPVPADFIVPMQSHNPLADQHTHLVTNCMAQARALLFGKSLQQAAQELSDAGYSDEAVQALAPHKVLPGNRPSLTISYDKTSPYRLGALIALYEHKVFVSSVIWGLNAFDQWGVELGKQIGVEIYNEIEKRRSGIPGDAAFDPSTEALLNQLLASEQIENAL
ncbi:glucose-6-phosphate isomerase [Aestuariicella hydrocarbonica]|uniref:Glucose-6-phosphate isomerase n=1 Tax=Pseudomaricurvus hydrocarbonicus TaxID=1470433 RepID=A0A9E5JXK6_9GAMM|nr:glucose-6-phosphate isomerase [Aestuariicella hydrocarbonica]NHO66390.1 glucose-6-phosphate isomerase [Aestuariicella hydrocarbonica]